MLNKLECFLRQRDAAAFSCVVYGLVNDPFHHISLDMNFLILWVKKEKRE
jgi:hypothetical protein